MIHAAAENGVHYVKMQTIFSEDLTPRGRFEYGETENNGVVKAIKRPFRPGIKRYNKSLLKKFGTLNGTRYAAERIVSDFLLIRDNS